MHFTFGIQCINGDIVVIRYTRRGLVNKFLKDGCILL
jgi:hypothetical protein